MAPIFQNCPNSKHLVTSGNVVGLYSPHIFQVQRTTETVQDCKMAEKHYLATFDTTHVQMNASVLVTRVSPRGPHSLAAHGVSYKATSTNAMQICNHAYVRIAVVTSLVLFCVSISLFLSLFLRCRGIVNRWWNNNRQRQTGSPLIPTINFRRRVLDFPPRSVFLKSRISRSMEVLPLFPYRENILPSHSESTILQDISAISMSSNLIQIDNQTNDRPNTTATARMDFVAHMATISSNPSSDSCEIPIPPTPLITPIQLPPIEDEIEIDDVANITTLSLQCNPADADIGEAQLEAPTASPNMDNSSDSVRVCFLVDGFVSDLSSHPASSSTSTPWPQGSLGLILEGGFSHIFETRASGISEI